MKPEFSIITCTYNSERFLPQTIQSVQTQTYTNFEHIFIDALSTDSTVTLIRDYQQKFPSQVKLFQQPPQGIAMAMNFGASVATGTILSYLHSDDTYASAQVLQHVTDAFIQQPKARWCIGDQIIINEADEVIEHWVTREYSFALLKRMNFIPHQATFIQKSLFDEVGGFRPYKYAMDSDLWLRIGEKNLPIQLHENLAKFRRHVGSLSTREARNTMREDYMIRRQLVRDPITRFRDYVNYRLNMLWYR